MLHANIKERLFGCGEKRVLTLCRYDNDRWLAKIGVKTLFIEPGSPWENGYMESFDSKLRDELLNGEVFTTLTEAKILIEQWHREYNHFRPHSTLGYRSPVLEAKLSVALT